MKYYTLLGELSGWLDAYPDEPITEQTVFIIDGWFGGKIITDVQHNLIESSLAQKLIDAGVTGCRFQDIKVKKEMQFVEMEPDIVLPHFKYMFAEPNVFVDDIGLDRTINFNLIVSEKFLDIVKDEMGEYVEVEEIGKPSDKKDSKGIFKKLPWA